jgi:secreted PhoX family phosphatase
LRPFGTSGVLTVPRGYVADVRAANVRLFEHGTLYAAHFNADGTGIVATPDGRSLFINIQHPGEPASERSDPAAPKAISTWPDGPAGGRPRAATVVIRKLDGGVIGT